MGNNFLTIQRPVEITEERFEDLLCNALEGGVSYWADIDTSIHPPQEGDENIEFPHLAFTHPKYVIHVVDREDDGNTFRLKLEDLKKGFQIWAKDCPYHFENFLKEDDDAVTADTFFQCCVFGEVIYS